MIASRTIAVVIPCHNEERLIERTLGRVPPNVDVVVVVDDGSVDRTFAVASAWARTDPRVRLVRLGHNRGVGGAIVEGYRRARACTVDIAVVMAGDDQMDPADLPVLVAPIVSGRADYVKGNRLAHPEARRMPLVRRTGSHVLGRITALAAGLDRLDDAQCGYTAVRLEVLDRIPLEDVFPRYGYPNDLILRLAAAGARIAEAPVRPVYADEVSGLALHRVVVPISNILLRGAARRAGLLSDQ